VNISELRRIAKRYGCSAHTQIRRGIQTVSISDPSYETRKRMSISQLAQLTEAELLPMLREWSHRNVTQFWTGDCEVMG